MIEIETLSTNAKVIRGAAKNAVLAWVVIYLVMFLALLGYRFSTRQYYLDHSVRVRAEHADALRVAEEAVAAAQEAYTIRLEEKKLIAKTKPKVVQTIKPPPIIKQVIQKVHKDNNPLKGYQEPLTRLKEELSSAHNSLLTKINVIDQGLSLLQELRENPVWSQDLSSSSSSKSHQSHSNDMKSVASLTDAWKRLMLVPSVGSIPDDNLDGMFSTVIDQISDILKEPPEDWTVIHQIFTNEETALVEKLPRDLICPTSVGEVDDDDPKKGVPAAEAHANAATIHDMDELILHLESSLSRRVAGAGVSALMPSTMTQVEEFLRKEIQELSVNISRHVETLEKQLVDRTQSVSSSELAASSSCFDVNFVTALVEAGLLAMAAQDDVREALRKTTLKWVPDMAEDNFILDADLPLASSSDARVKGSYAMKSRAVINLRSILDSPLLAESVGWLDQLVELFGGYSDEVDRYLDSLTVGRGGGGRDVSVGEVAVESLLQYAGMVGDIDLRDVARKLAEKLPQASRQKILDKL